mmetsp:Transcript_4759/g.13342  ORF Transcript_4759/g.13342 Transcript_4759/m.13342 type:complete len:239 (-) Transcript_4759:247-963(-)
MRMLSRSAARRNLASQKLSSRRYRLSLSSRYISSTRLVLAMSSSVFLSRHLSSGSNTLVPGTAARPWSVPLASTSSRTRAPEPLALGSSTCRSSMTASSCLCSTVSDGTFAFRGLPRVPGRPALTAGERFSREPTAFEGTFFSGVVFPLEPNLFLSGVAFFVAGEVVAFTGVVPHGECDEPAPSLGYPGDGVFSPLSNATRLGGRPASPEGKPRFFLCRGEAEVSAVEAVFSPAGFPL